MQSAGDKAQDRLREAEELQGRCDFSEPSAWLERMQNLLTLARVEYLHGQQIQAEIADLTGEEAIYQISCATRRFNSSQVYASQVSQIVNPPVHLPIDL